jgi:hypothetical protein
MTPPENESQPQPGGVPGPKLTEGQVRHLRVCLGGLLAEAEDVLSWVRQSDASAEPWIGPTIVELERLLVTVRETASALALSLSEDTVDPRHRIGGWASTWWASVLDCRPSALRGYGVVHPDTERSLTPRIDQIARLLLRIEALSREPRP